MQTQVVLLLAALMLWSNDARAVAPSVSLGATVTSSGVDFRVCATSSFTESHHEVGHPPQQRRIPKRLDNTNPGSLVARKRSLLGAALVMTSPGVPMIFQGQEILEDQDFAFPAGTPIDWSKAKTFSGITAAYHDLIALRKETAALFGDGIQIYHQNDSAKVIAFARGSSASLHPLVVLVNFGSETFKEYRIGLPSNGHWKVAFSRSEQLANWPNFHRRRPSL